MATAISNDDKKEIMQFEHNLKIERENLRHKNAMEELLFMAEHQIKNMGTMKED